MILLHTSFDTYGRDIPDSRIASKSSSRIAVYNGVLGSGGVEKEWRTHCEYAGHADKPILHPRESAGRHACMKIIVGA